VLKRSKELCCLVKGELICCYCPKCPEYHVLRCKEHYEDYDCPICGWAAYDSDTTNCNVVCQSVAGCKKFPCLSTFRKG